MDLFLSQLGYIIAIVVGFFGRRAKIFTKDSLIGLRFIVLYFLFPLSLYPVGQKENWKYMGYGLAYALALILLSTFLLWILQFNKKEIFEYLPALFLSNSLLLGFFFLDPHLGFAIRNSFIAFSMANLSVIYLYLILKERKSSRKLMVHLLMVFLIVAFFILGPKLPGFFQRGVQRLAGERGVFFYFLYLMIGIKLPEIKLREIISWNEFLVVALSLLILPVFMTIGTRILTLNFFVKSFIIISTLMPTSPLVILLEEEGETHLLKVFLWTQLLGLVSVRYLFPLLA